MSDSVGRVGNMAPIDINNQEISSITLNGNTDIDTVEVNGQTVFTSAPANTFDIDFFTFTNASLSAGPFPLGVTISDDGTKLHVIQLTIDEIQQFSFGTPYDLSTVSSTPAATISSQNTQPTSVRWSNDGLQYFELEASPGVIYQRTATTPYDITSLGPQISSLSLADGNSSGVCFNDDGTQIYLTGLFQNRVRRRNLSTPFDLSTASGVIDDVPTGTTGTEEILFNNDGTRFYVVEKNTGSIQQFDVSTPFDINSLSFDTSLSTPTSTPTGLVFKNDGSKLYTCERNPDVVREAEL